MKQAIVPTAHPRTFVNARLVPAARVTGSMLGLLLCIFVGLVAGCSSKDKDGKGGDGDGGQSKGKAASEANVPLTAEFFPLNAGKERKLLSRKYKVNATTSEVTFKEVRGSLVLGKDQIDKVLVGPGVLTLALLEDKKGGSNYGSFRKTDTKIESLRSVQPQSWAEFIKPGATPGDKWTSQKVSYEYVRCEQNDGVPCAIVAEVQSNTKSSTKWVWFLMKGVGIVKIEMYATGKGERADSWVPELEFICDDWKGEKTPLVIEKVKK